jgi:hypothetical protein
MKRGIFTESLEYVSRNLFRDHIEIITELIGDSSGIYALYSDNELYYVGRASDLKRRVHQHLKDRHLSAWTHFSLFLIQRNDYIGDLESLIIRIAEPVGNRVKPKGRDSKQMIKKLKALLAKKHKEEMQTLLAGRTRRMKKSNTRNPRTLEGVITRKTAIYKTFKGKEYKAFVFPNGEVLLNGKSFPSLSSAAKEITGRPANGWQFWSIKNADGDWVRLLDFVNSI